MAAVGLAVAWLVPPVAIPVAWPILLVLPGWAVLAVLRPRIDAVGRIGLAVVISIVLSTHLVYWLARLLDGYDRPVVFVALAILGIGSAVVLMTRDGGRPRLPRATWPALAVT